MLPLVRLLSLLVFRRFRRKRVDIILAPLPIGVCAAAVDIIITFRLAREMINGFRRALAACLLRLLPSDVGCVRLGARATIAQSV